MGWVALARSSMWESVGRSDFVAGRILIFAILEWTFEEVRNDLDE